MGFWGVRINGVPRLVGSLLPTSTSVQLGSSGSPLGIVWFGGRVDFKGAASTFAQIGTLTNAPAATNPTNWVEVTYNSGASTGRIPIW